MTGDFSEIERYPSDAACSVGGPESRQGCTKSAPYGLGYKLRGPVFDLGEVEDHWLILPW